MVKRGYNWKARQVHDTVVDDAPTKKIKLDLSIQGNYDRSNELVLPSKKRKTKVKNKSEKITRILSNKQRKRLEKVVEKKEKKLLRANLLEELAKVQATPEEIKQLTSIAAVQTKGLKKLFSEEKTFKSEKGVDKKTVIVNSIKGAYKKNSASQHPNNKKLPLYDKNNPNIVGFESSAESDTEDEDDENNVNNENSGENNFNNESSGGNNVNNENSGENNPEIPSDEVTANAEEIHEKLSSNEKIVAKNIGVKNEKAKIKEIDRKPAIFVEVDRSDEIQKARLKLPILAEEQQIMEIINENSVIIIAGETGSGKTTQVPQFLYEAGYARKRMIGITEPRRVAAISMSKRVAEEMNLSADEVSYLIRYEGNVTDQTKIKFMTDGVLFRELKSDFLLAKYSVIILDEAHERSVYTDVLIGMLSRIVPLRQKRNDPLKLIIMSATLRLQDFTQNRRLFSVSPPVINVEARQFPVTVHFNRRTNENYLKEALRKTVKIHTTLPDGGVLVFVTGQREVNHLVRKLRSLFPLKRKDKVLSISKGLNAEVVNEDSSEDEDFDRKLNRVLKKRKRNVKIVPDIDLDDYPVGDEENNSDGDADDVSEDEDEEDFVVAPANAQPLWVLPLFSFLPSHKQVEVFQEPPSGCRLCVVSTNVAETSLTIPNIKYVVDTGKTKVKLYDKVTGVTTYVVDWTSKASADQRGGRAGRTGPGHCYRLYSSAVFNDVFKQFSEPEIQRKPIDDLYLQMKCMHLDKIVNFPFPTAPDLMQLRTAESRLEALELLENSKVTPLGKVVAKFPVSPRFGKMLALSLQFDLLPYTICLVAALSVQEVLLETPIGAPTEGETKEKWAVRRRSWVGQGNSLLMGDPMVLLKAIGGAEFANSKGKLAKFCEDNGLRHKAVLEIRKLRIQLTNEIKASVPDIEAVVDPELKPPTDVQAKLLRQLLLCGMGDQIARKMDQDEINSKEDRAKYKYAYTANDMEEPVFLHRGSVLRKTLPEYVIYQEIYEINKMYIRGITAIEPDWLATYVPKLCNLGKPLADPEPWFDENSGKVKCMVSGTFGKQAWPLSNCEIDYPKTQDGFKWFTKFFLEGKVFVKLQKYNESLLQPAGVVTKPWAKLQPRIVRILNRITGANCRSRNDVEEAWDKDPKFLLEEYLLWLPDSAHSVVSLSWPPLNR